MSVRHDSAVNVPPHVTLNSDWDNVGKSVSLRRNIGRKGGTLLAFDYRPKSRSCCNFSCTVGRFAIGSAALFVGVVA